MFQCDECGINFVFQYQLILHRNLHKTVPSFVIPDENPKQVIRFCDRCSIGFYTHNLYVEHLQKHDDMDKQCSLCSKVFASIKNLENHLRLHTRETQFYCSTCNKLFNRKDRLTKHEITHKSEFYCTRCEVTFNTKKQLLAHRRSVHETQKSHNCTQCNKKYTRNEHLQKHIQSHSSDLQHSCRYCGQQFWRGSHLESHYNVHKVNDARDECACAVCGEFFKTNLLKKHMENAHNGISDNFKCEICKESFKNKGNLLFHKRSHQNNEK